MKILLFLPLFFLCCGSNSASTEPEHSSSIALSSSSQAHTVPADSQGTTPRFIHWDGSQFLDSTGNAFAMRGVAFGNEVWSQKEPSAQHHSSVDFNRVASLGMNTIRFYLSYRFWENDNAPYAYKQSGWDWLDSNVAFAREHGIYLILNMHIPQGGFQSLGEGGELWTNPDNQKRLKALWVTIAARYSNEKAILGYDLVNEPVVTQSKEQWQQLAQELIDTIRTADTNHLIFVERMNGTTAGDYSNDEDMNYVDVTDPYHKTGLTFHMYAPIEYTHQNASWTNFGEGGAYPDTTKLYVESAKWVTGNFGNPSVPAGDSDWAWYNGKLFTVLDSSIKVAKPVLSCANSEQGVVWFDSLVVERVSPLGLDTLLNVQVATVPDWWLWSANDKGTSGFNHSDKPGYYHITGTTEDANAGANSLRFTVQAGTKLRVHAKMSGQSVPPSAECTARLDFESGEVHVRNKAFLQTTIQNYFQYAAVRNLPVYLGEFGVYKDAFLQNKGGERWVQDVIDIVENYSIGWTYHTWHEDAFGIYYGHGPIDETNANAKLLDIFHAM
jgi:endoglucanase